MAGTRDGGSLTSIDWQEPAGDPAMLRNLYEGQQQQLQAGSEGKLLDG